MICNVHQVTKSFKGSKGKRLIANDQLDFHINEGEIFGLLGHNGAGKTTIVNQILGLLKPDSGHVELLGEPVLKSPVKSRSICSVQPQSQVPLSFLTPRQAVTIMGKMRAGKSFDPKRLDYLFEALDMGEWVDKIGESLSGGAQRLTAFCMACIAPGKLVVLDEPTNDVDPVRRRFLWDVIRSLTADGTSVILVTHNVIEAEKAVDRLAIMHQGKIITQGTPAEVKSSVSNLLRVELNLFNPARLADAPDWAISASVQGTRLIFAIDPEYVTRSVEWLQDQVENGSAADYALTPTTLEDVYVQLTSGKELNQHEPVPSV